MREHDIDVQIKRENKIIRLKKKGLSFEEIQSQIGDLSLNTIMHYHSSGLLRKKLNKEGINTSNLSTPFLTELVSLKSLSIQLELINKFQAGVFKNRHEFRKAKKELEIAVGVAVADTDATIDQEFDPLEMKKMNGVNTELKLISKYKDLAEKTMRLMKKDKLQKYSENTQGFCLEIMKNLKNYLEEQLGVRRVINVTQ